MLLKRVTIQNFRNIPFATLDFTGHRQFLVGSNGQGKTNLLEAVGYVTALRSFRTADHRLLIRRGEKEAAIASLFEHDIMGETRVQIGIRPDGRQATVDQEKVTRLGDIIGKFPTVVFSSDDIQLIRASPGTRRRWVDLVLAAADPEYLRLLQQYHRALEGRNRLLKGRAGDRELASFEATMSPLAAGVYQKRRVAIGRVATLVRQHYQLISGGREEAAFRFRPDVDSAAADDFMQHWSRGRSRDFLYGSTQKGPHRDDYLLQLDGQSAREYASEGQQRGLVLALRLAQVDYFCEMLRVVPVLLADDIVNELDPVRRQSFWKAIGDQAQVVATGTSLPSGGDWQVFEVRDGSFQS